MQGSKKRRLESAGWRVGSAAEFLDLSPEEAALVELKLALADYLKELRGQHGWTQVEVAALLKSSQSRVAKMEAADPSVSVDLLVRALLTLGASRKDLDRFIPHLPQPGGETGDRKPPGGEVRGWKPRLGRLEVRAGQPLVFYEDSRSDDDVPTPSAELRQAATQVGDTIKAYRDAAKELLGGKYSDLREFAPNHLKEPCDITVIHGNNGVIVRYDLGTEGATKVRSGTADATLTELAPRLSESVVHFPMDRDSYDPGPDGLMLEMAKIDLETGQTEPISSFRFLILAPLEFPEGVSVPPPPSRPPCLLSLTNELQIVMAGVVAPADPDSAGNVERARDFVAKGAMRLQVGWQALEIYPLFQADYWKPEFAPLWAESDLLAAVARRQFVEAQFASIDPNVAARNGFRHLLEELARLLDGPEEPAHQFLKKHPEILSPTNTATWSKLRLGDRVTDFVFREPANEYLLVEIESPLRELFRKDGQQREELTHAFNQIIDWRTFIEDNLRIVQKELGLTNISSNPRSLIVIGRSDRLSQEDRRKLITLQNQIPRLRILTYDDLIQSSKAVAENLFGPLDITGQNVEIYFAQTKPGAA